MEHLKMALTAENAKTENPIFKMSAIEEGSQFMWVLNLLGLQKEVHVSMSEDVEKSLKCFQHKSLDKLQHQPYPPNQNNTAHKHNMQDTLIHHLHWTKM